jgi:uncharacterized cofD-like protein
MPVTNPLKLVAIGGGTGLSTLLVGLKPYLSAEPMTMQVSADQHSARRAPALSTDQSSQPQVALTAIVTVTDDGKSSGRLREEFDVLPPGDIRNCLVALADENRLLTKLFDYRFPGEGALGGHSLGNLLILALNQMSGDFLAAIEQARALLGIEARVLPSTLDRVDLVAQVGGQTVRGQMAIKSHGAPIRQLRLDPGDARALPEAIEAILTADLITLGPGSLFTSVIPNVLVAGIADALARSPAQKIYLCNAMTEAHETDDYSAEDHVRALLKYARGLALDYALFNSAPISAEMRRRYAAEKATALDPPTASLLEGTGTKFISLPLASEARFVRHDPEKLSRAIFDLYHLS